MPLRMNMQSGRNQMIISKKSPVYGHFHKTAA